VPELDAASEVYHNLDKHSRYDARKPPSLALDRKPVVKVAATRPVQQEHAHADRQVGVRTAQADREQKRQAHTRAHDVCNLDQEHEQEHLQSRLVTVRNVAVE